MKRMPIMPLLCVLTFGCEEISNDLSKAASELKTGFSDIVGELDTALNGTQSEPENTKLRTDPPTVPQLMFTGKVVRKLFTRDSNLPVNSIFRIIVQGDDGRAISFNLRGHGTENMNFMYDVHDGVSFPLDSETLKKKFSLNYAQFMDVDIQLRQPTTTQPAAKPMPVPEQAKPELVKPKPDKPPVEEKQKEFGTLFDEEPQS